MLIKIFSLLFLFQLKHFIADFPLQGKYMLGKFKPGWDFVLPLVSHCLVHSTFTLLIVMLYGSTAYWLAALDFVAHFSMDRIKASPKYLGKFKALSANEFTNASEEAKKNNTYFWWALGLDQAVHHMTHYFIIWCLV